MDDPQAVFYIYFFLCYKITLMYNEIEYVLQHQNFPFLYNIAINYGIF